MVWVVLLLLVLAIIGIVAQTDEQYYHQVFPAARFEQYTFDSSLLRTLNPKNFTIRFHVPDDDDSVNEFVEHARQRYMEFWFMGVPTTPPPKPSNTSALVPLDGLDVYVSTKNLELKLETDESYSLTISQDDNAVLKSETVFGMLRGLETFGQLLNYGWKSRSSNTFVIFFTPLVIEDEPVYPHRGLMIDTARHFLPLNLILDTLLDAMAMNKMNVLHWHMTDNQSFPFRSATFPELADKGSFAPDLVYKPDDVRRVVREAYWRGIRVIPEVDMPGHTQAIANSHPELMSRCPSASGPLNPASSKVYDFITQFYDEIIELFPDEFVHVGGDEVDFGCWKRDGAIQSWKKQHNMTSETELFKHFEQELLKIVASKKRNVIVWQEVFNLGLLSEEKNRAVVDVWKGYDVDTIQQATSASFQVLISGCWYLDHLDKRYLDFHQCLPRNFTATYQQKQRVIGGHASMWGERADATNFVSRVWPRASATAERLWSGDLILGDNNDTITMNRIAKFRCQMLARGIQASPVGPSFCNVGPSKKNTKQHHTSDTTSFGTTDK